MIYKTIIRQSIRQLRMNLNNSKQNIASLQVAHNAIHFKPIIKAKKIAIFFSVNGEINTNLLILKLWNLNKNIYLPILNPNLPYHLLFIQYTPQTKLILNKFNIPEPIFEKKKIININQLDIIILPLVAFDLRGQRLGMGKGFYDRTLQKYKLKNIFLLGLAHDFQLIHNLPNNNLDVPLSAVLTPSNIWYWKQIL